MTARLSWSHLMVSTLVIIIVIKHTALPCFLMSARFKLYSKYFHWQNSIVQFSSILLLWRDWRPQDYCGYIEVRGVSGGCRHSSQHWLVCGATFVHSGGVNTLNMLLCSCVCRNVAMKIWVVWCELCMCTLETIHCTMHSVQIISTTTITLSRHHWTQLSTKTNLEYIFQG